MARAHKTVKLKASELIEDFDLYPRNAVFNGHVNRLAELLEAGAVFPPTRADAKSKRLTDGFHRRRATIKVHGEDAPVDVTLVDYENERAMVKDAIALNVIEARGLGRADIGRCAVLAKKFKITRDELAGLLCIQREKLDVVVSRRVATTEAGAAIIVRHPMEHLAGQKLTSQQEHIVSRVGGHAAVQLARQLANLIETDSLPPDDDKLIEQLRRLHELLGKLLAVA